LVVVIWLLCSAARSSLCSNVVNALARIAHAVRSWKRAPADEVAVEAQKRDRKQKVLHMQRICKVMALLSLPINLAKVFQCVRMDARPDTIAHDAVVFVLHSTLTVTLVLPRAVSWRTIDVVYCTLVSCAALFVAPPPISDAHDDNLISHLIGMNMIVAALAVARRDVYVVLPMNALFTLASGTSMWVHEGPYLTAPAFVFFIQCCTMLMVTGGACILDSTWRALIYEGLAVTAARQLLSAATGLLRSCCDTVVEVDSEGVITVPAHDLGSFLLRGPGYNLHGYRLADLMVDAEDRDVFQDRLLSKKEVCMDMAESIHVRMRDGNNVVLRLQLLFLRFTHIDDSTRYMVGIRGNFPGLGEHGGQDGLRPLAPGSDGEEPTPRPSSSGLSVVTPAAADAMSAASDLLPVLVVDCTAPGFPVVECSVGFRARIGRVPPSGMLLDAVKHGTLFVQWLQHALHSMVYGAPPPDDCEVTLRVPRSGVVVAAACRVLRVGSAYDAARAPDGQGPDGEHGAEGPDIEDGAEGAAPLGPDALRRVELVFLNIRLRRAGPSHQSWGRRVRSARPALMGL